LVDQPSLPPAGIRGAHDKPHARQPVLRLWETIRAAAAEPSIKSQAAMARKPGDWTIVRQHLRADA
jgi:hypothetical protein